MGTVLTCRGKVARLVSKEWYDDGPLRGGLSSLESFNEDAALPMLLKQTSAEHVVQDLVKLLGSRGSVQSNLSWLLRVNELHKRPELVEAIATEFAFDRKTPFQDRMRLAVVTVKYSDRTIAARIMRTTEKRFRQRLKKGAVGQSSLLEGLGSEQDLIELLIAYKPKLARRYIKSSSGLGESDHMIQYRREAIARIDRQLQSKSRR